MAFSLSPAVTVTEIDLTTIVPTVATTIGAMVGDFTWGPADEVTLVTSEDNLIRLFGKPTTRNAANWFTAASFLAYGDQLRVVRVVDDTARNASKGGLVANQITNDVIFKNDLELGNFLSLADTNVSAARFLGSLGDSLKVSICGSADAFEKQGFIATGVTGNNVAAVDVGKYVTIGSKVIVTNPGTGTVAAGTVRKVVGVVSDSGITLDSAAGFAVDTEFTTQWEYRVFFGNAPGTSAYAELKGGTNDEMHVVIVDEDGGFTGLKGQVIERFEYLSKAADAKTVDGASSYWMNFINNRSRYIKIINNPSDNYHLTGQDFDWGSLGSSDFPTDIPPITESYSGGSVGGVPSDGQKMLGWDLYKNSELININLCVMADSSVSVSQYVINNICEWRKDCVAFLSPYLEDVLDPINATQNVIDRREMLGISTSYAVMDSTWKEMRDKYNDVTRWVPLNGDCAGLCVRTDKERDPWFSPAGLNRGQIKNFTRLAFYPDKAQRDELYEKGVNSVVSFGAQGTVLWGDKTLLAKPSAFSRINVRRLFIVLEVAISTAARYSLFELNDEFTRSQFVNMVTPYLRTVKAGRGIYDFRVVCDESNNTGDIIDRNVMVGDIYIKPARSINEVKLNFIAVRTDVAFEEVVGRF